MSHLNIVFSQMNIFVSLLLYSITICNGELPLLNEIGSLYLSNAYLDDVNSIAIDSLNNNIYASNTASGTIDIISYKIGASPATADLQVTRSIDIQLQSSPYFKLDYITSVAYSSAGYIIASLIPLNYATTNGWLVFIDVNTQYIYTFIELKYCYSPKHIQSTSDGKKIIIACEGLEDSEINDPEGSISIIDMRSDINDATKWKIYNVDFKDFDCIHGMDDGHSLKQLPNGIYLPNPDAVFSINVEPEFITIDDTDKYAYITLQENNGVAILDINKLEIVQIFSLGAHDFGFSGLDASDMDNAINIKTYANLYGLRQADGITYYSNDVSGNEYILTANEGNPKYSDMLRVNQLSLNTAAFPNGDVLKDDTNLGRLKVLASGSLEYGEEDDGTFSKLYTFGSRDFTIWQVEKDNNNGGNDDDGGDNCPCDYPYGLRLAFSSYDDFEQITAAFGDDNSFNSDFYNPSFDTRSADKGPEPESITVGECSNGDTYVFIGLERVGGVMVYDITDIDANEVYFVQYLNSREFSVDYLDKTRPPIHAGNIEPETLIFLADTMESNNMAYLFVGYKTSASIGVYSFNCGANRNYDRDGKPQIPYPTTIAHTVDQCIDQSPCLDIDIRPTINQNQNQNQIQRRRILQLENNNNAAEMYEICVGFNNQNPYCKKEQSYFIYGEFTDDEQSQSVDNDNVFKQWFKIDMRCTIVACDSYVSFSILDGNGCKNSNPLMVSIDSIDNIECKTNENDDFDSCQWKIPAPKCTVNVNSITTQIPNVNIQTTILSTTNNNNNYDIIPNEGDGNGNGVQTDNNKENKSTFDTMTNKGGHFYESTMFFILLTISIFTCVAIIGCVVRSQKKATAQIEGDEPEIQQDGQSNEIQEQPLQFEE